MKLFFDENLSSKLVHILEQEFPESNHVRNVGLRGTEDIQIWNNCKKENFIIVSKDADFREGSFTKGYPPKVIWLDVGNAGTIEIAELLHHEKNEFNNLQTKRNRLC